MTDVERAILAARNAEHEPEYWLVLERPLTAADLRDLAAGRPAPEWVRDACRMLFDFSLPSGRLDYVGRREAQQRRTTRLDAVGRRKVAR